MNPLTILGVNSNFNKQLEELRPRLYRVAFSWSHNPELSDDLVQETMVKALKNAHQVKNKDAIDGWLFGILNNCWRDHFRRIKEVEDIDNIVLINEVTPSHVVEAHSIVERVRLAIASLPSGQSQVVTLVDLEGFSYNEVADILNVPVGTIMSRLCRARSTLSNKLMELQSDTHLKKVSRLRSI